MPGPLLITAIALALTYGLLRLRHCLVACSKEPQPSYRAYVMWFAETDGYADGDDDVHEDAETDDILGLRPAEIVGHARHFPRDYGHYEDDVWANRGGSDVSARGERLWPQDAPCHRESPFDRATDAFLTTGFLLPGRSLAPAHRPDKLRSQTTYHCPTCGQHAWATPTARLLCGICKRPMQAYR